MSERGPTTTTLSIRIYGIALNELNNQTIATMDQAYTITQQAISSSEVERIKKYQNQLG